MLRGGGARFLHRVDYVDTSPHSAGMSLLDIFSKKQPPDQSELLNLRLSEIERALETLQRSAKGLQLEWENTYDKVNRAVQRLNKRARDAEKAEDPPGATTVTEARVTPASELRARVLRRRRHG